VKRTVITYGGSQYTIPDEDTEQVRDHITSGLQSEPFIWLQVNHGEGRATPALLLISPSTPVAIITERDADEDTAHPDAARYALDPGHSMPGSLENHDPEL
jgi:hypothetical protein